MRKGTANVLFLMCVKVLEKFSQLGRHGAPPVSMPLEMVKVPCSVRAWQEEENCVLLAGDRGERRVLAPEGGEDGELGNAQNLGVAGILPVMQRRTVSDEMEREKLSA